MTSVAVLEHLGTGGCLSAPACWQTALTQPSHVGSGRSLLPTKQHAAFPGLFSNLFTFNHYARCLAAQFKLPSVTVQASTPHAQIKLKRGSSFVACSVILQPLDISASPPLDLSTT